VHFMIYVTAGGVFDLPRISVEKTSPGEIAAHERRADGAHAPVAALLDVQYPDCDKGTNEGRHAFEARCQKNPSGADSISQSLVTFFGSAPEFRSLFAATRPKGCRAP
jgi:hypothetical protein